MADAASDDSVRGGYIAHGTRGYYEQFGADYQNPHEPAIRTLIEWVTNHWPVDVSHVLDLAAGSGEVTLALAPKTGHIDAVDPYTGLAYSRRVGRPCECMSFEEIAAGGLRGRTYSLIVCSFALHLAELSRLPTLCWELAGVADQLLILTPHKRPVIDDAWGWTLTQETVRQRVRARLYVVQPEVKGLR